jgi:hypothetical protein
MGEDQLSHGVNSHPPQAVQDLLEEGEIRSLALLSGASRCGSLCCHAVCATTVVVGLIGCLDVEAADAWHVRSIGVA